MYKKETYSTTSYSEMIAEDYANEVVPRIIWHLKNSKNNKIEFMLKTDSNINVDIVLKYLRKLGYEAEVSKPLNGFTEIFVRKSSLAINED